MIKITRFFYIHLLVLPLIAVAFFTKSQMTFFIAYGVVLIHELCHLLAALCLNVKVYSIIVMPFGMTLRLDSSVMRSPKKEAAIALAGPLSNALMLLFGFCLFDVYAPSLNFYLFMVINGALLILNLIPVPPLDGGRIVRAAVIHHAGLIPAAKITRRISYVFIGLICVMGVLLLILFRGNPSLIMIGAFLFYSLADEKKNSDILIMREMIYEKEKLKSDSLIPSKMICVHQNTPAKRILRKLNLSTFYIISIIDDNMRILRTVTESDFIRSVTAKGYGILSKDVV